MEMSAQILPFPSCEYIPNNTERTIGFSVAIATIMELNCHPDYIGKTIVNQWKDSGFITDEEVNMLHRFYG